MIDLWCFNISLCLIPESVAGLSEQTESLEKHLSSPAQSPPPLLSPFAPSEVCWSQCLYLCLS